jgi:hypothetical protein
MSETAFEMADGFEMRQALRGILASLQPLIDRAFGIAGGGQMMRQEFGLALDEICEVSLQHRRDAGVQLLSSRAQQCAVGGVLHQRVLEEVGGVRRDAAAEQQPGLGEPVEPGPELVGGPLRHLLNQLVAELAAEHCTHLPNLLGERPEPVEPRD